METVCALVTTERVFAFLGVVWFIAYGFGTPWQIRYENPQATFTWWTKVSQFFAHGGGAAAGWLAVYMLWELWKMRPEHFDLSYVALFVVAYLGITGLLPHAILQIVTATASKTKSEG